MPKFLQISPNQNVNVMLITDILRVPDKKIYKIYLSGSSGAVTTDTLYYESITKFIKNRRLEV